MINTFLEKQIKAHFPHCPTPEQSAALEKLAQFMLSPDPDSAFILNGYAGTGKTSLIAAIVRTMDQLKQKVVLLAPTGRAAKVLLPMPAIQPSPSTRKYTDNANSRTN